MHGKPMQAPAKRETFGCDAADDFMKKVEEIRKNLYFILGGCGPKGYGF